MQTASKKVINGWAMYDWANSAYNLVITSTIFPAYFESITGDNNDATVDKVTFLGREYINTALYNYALAVAFLIVAIMSPLLSSVADYRGNKKSFLRFFMTMGSLACSALFFYNETNLWLGILAMIVACVGYWSSLVFYNSFLPEIASVEDRDRISAKGFSFGYIGSVILQIICFVFVMAKPFGISGGFAAQLSFLLVGIWWFSFASFSLKQLPNSLPIGTDQTNSVTHGYAELRKVWQQVMVLPVLKRFLCSFFFYNMGVQTVMLAATNFGSKVLNLPSTKLIITVVIIQLVAIAGAFIMSRLSKKFGNLQVLIGVVIFWIGVCFAGYKMQTEYHFYGLAVAVGLVMGGIQALSRSTYSKLMPATKDTASFFSFYDVTEKVAIVIGLSAFGFIEELTNDMRNSVLSLIVFFTVGLVGLLLALSKQNKLNKNAA